MKRYLITGASRGIGRAIAEKLATAGDCLLLHGRDREALRATCQLVDAKKAKAIPLLYDLRDPAAIRKMVDEIGPEQLDGLINNAGIAFVKPLSEISLEEWQRTLEVNVTAPFLLTQKLMPIMPAGSTIVNILSIAAKSGFANWSSYCMSKFALEGFSQAVREEVRPRGIRVLNIYPAATSTEIWKGVEGDWPREKMLAPEEVANAVTYALSRPSDVAIENITLQNVSGTL
jgi:NAD(P)-dependent dehydrogenase (short-subunit alcohol dehydrogenase family)